MSKTIARVDAIQLTKKQKLDLDKRKRSHFSGKSKSYTWSETEQMIKTQKN